MRGSKDTWQRRTQTPVDSILHTTQYPSEYCVVVDEGSLARGFVIGIAFVEGLHVLKDTHPIPFFKTANQMAEVESNPPQLVADVAVAGDSKEAGNRRGGKRENRKAPEELYDLSQPIPKVNQPDKALHEKEVDTITLAIEAVKRDKLALQTKIDAVSASSNRNSAGGSEKEVIQQLKMKKSALIEEKKSLKKRVDDSKAILDKLLNERKATKVQVRFESLAKIEEEIAKLKRLQQSTSMSLTDEKKLIKEIDSLQSSKMMLADLDGNQKKMDVSRDAIKALNDEIKAKDSVIDAVQKDIDDRQKALASLGDSEKEAREGRKKLLDQREELKKLMDSKYKELDQVRDKFRQETDTWFDYQRAIKAQERLKREEERKKREEEHLAYLKKKEEEELKKVPYEEEMYLCDFLADYLTRTYLGGDGKKTDKEKEEEGAKSSSVGLIPDNPFANVQPAKKKNDEVFLQMGKGGKQTRPRTESKKITKATASAPVPFTMSIDMFEQFGWVHLNPPMSLESVEKSVHELKEKKIWYSQQPRGTVVTAKDMRKAKEKTTTKSSENGVADSTPATVSGAKGGRKGFDLSSDEQFAPLSSSTAGFVSPSTWGESKTTTPNVEGEAVVEDTA